ncbi:MAG: hypothetical protein ACRCWY_12835 [Cellulosilyticaceae bacterium]
MDVSVVAIIGSCAFLFAVLIYFLAILGLPVGDFAMGGRYKVFPPAMRVVIGISMVVQLFAIIILLQGGGLLPLFFSPKVTKGICMFFAAYLALNSIMNLSSTSKKERYIATPLSVITAICFLIVGLSPL